MPDSATPQPGKSASPTVATAPATSTHTSHAGFPWLLFLIALGAVTAGHWLAVALFHFAFPCIGFGLAIVAFLFTCVCALWLRSAHHYHPWPKRKRDIVWQFLLVWAVFAGGIVFALSAEHWLLHGFFHLEQRYWIFLAVAVVAVVGFSYWQNRLAPGFNRPRSLRPMVVKDVPQEQRFEALILCVSTPNQRQSVAPHVEVPKGAHAQVSFGDGTGVAVLHGQSIRGDIAEITRAADAAHAQAVNRAKEASKPVSPFKPYWNWQQLLRAIEHHAALKQIWLVGSPGEGGSFDHLEECERFLDAYKPGIIRRVPQPVEFEDFDTLVSTIRDLLARELKAVTPGKIGVDVTGGLKVASIAGAALTMNRELRIQYVQTNEPHDAVIYQLFFESAPSPHGH